MFLSNVVSGLNPLTVPGTSFKTMSAKQVLGAFGYENIKKFIASIK
jgi:hypothetical protein